MWIHKDLLLSFPFLFRSIVYRGTWQCSAERKSAPREGVKMHRSVFIHLTYPKDLALLTIDDDRLYSHRSVQKGDTSFHCGVNSSTKGNRAEKKFESYTCQKGCLVNNKNTLQEKVNGLLVIALSQSNQSLKQLFARWVAFCLVPHVYVYILCSQQIYKLERMKFDRLSRHAFSFFYPVV